MNDKDCEFEQAITILLEALAEEEIQNSGEDVYMTFGLFDALASIGSESKGDKDVL